MKMKNKIKELSPTLLLPIGLLIFEIVVVLFIKATGREISSTLENILLILGLFLVYQIVQEIVNLVNMSKAVQQIERGDQLVKSGDLTGAIKLWKNLLLKLPRQHFQSVLSKLEVTYQQENMLQAVRQVQMIQSESDALFSATTEEQRMTKKNREAWQVKSLKIRDMIHELPVGYDQDFLEVPSEEDLD